MSNHNRAKVLLLVWVFGAAACSRDIFDVDVAFMPQSYAFDFGAQTGDLPVVACDADDDPCTGISATLDSDDTIRALRVGCSPTEGRCYVQADAELAVTLSLLEQSDFRTKVQRRGVELVRSIDLAYAIPVNTLSFVIPQVDIYVGPEGTRRFDDSGVLFVDSIKTLPAGAVTELPTHHLVVADHSAARALLADKIIQQQPFVFVLAMSPRLMSGQPIPAGLLTVELHPLMRLGIPE
ncbi:MAG TPA: hypothetical protein VFH73_09055 [Polyangia bacterium]|nr:hypothetical protein [Polyangia bacterium]